MGPGSGSGISFSKRYSNTMAPVAIKDAMVPDVLWVMGIWFKPSGVQLRPAQPLETKVLGQ